jgi:two-component system chemotaxis response regulator CheB
MGNIRVLVVDDSFFMRKVIRDMLVQHPDIEVVGEASDGKEALEKISALHPTVVTLDIEMPRMNGIEALRDIVAVPGHPSVVMVSGYPQEGQAMTLECLSLGAADFVVKPSGSFSLDMDKVKDILLTKVVAAATADTSKIRGREPSPPGNWKYAKHGGVVIIGASTGGPAALEGLLPELPANFPYSIVVAQHLPKEFTDLFIGRLQSTCALIVTRAENGLSLDPGTIYIAAGGTNTTISKPAGKAVFVVETNTVDIETPSISKLMASAAEVYSEKTIGVVLTGMGSDGLLGMDRIKQAGGTTLVQDEATSAVYGMGREVVENGLADYVTSLDALTKKINELLV